MEIAVTPITGSVNRATTHLVVIDYGTQPRLIQRVTIKGERPY